jgi:hypothetical protein
VHVQTVGGLSGPHEHNGGPGDLPPPDGVPPLDGH